MISSKPYICFKCDTSDGFLSTLSDSAVFVPVIIGIFKILYLSVPTLKVSNPPPFEEPTLEFVSSSMFLILAVGLSEEFPTVPFLDVDL